MRMLISLLLLLGPCLTAPNTVAADLPGTAGGCEAIFNPNGWSLPKKELFKLDEIQAVALPGVPHEIVAEKWRPKKISEELGTTLPLYQEPEQSSVGPITSDEVLFLTTYKTKDGRIICHLCTRVLQFKPGLYGLVYNSYVCDLDGDGSYESQFPCQSDSEEALLLASIARIKLGQSGEDWLVNKMVLSILCQLKESGRGGSEDQNKIKGSTNENETVIHLRFVLPFRVTPPRGSLDRDRIEF